MAGINAAASTTTFSASSADAAASGFITGDQVVLTTAPTGTDYQWSLAIPSGSNALRVRFSGDDTATASFVPDVAGIYAIGVVVDGTTYTLRLSVTQLAVSTALEALRLQPVTDSQIAVPVVGCALYFSSTQGALAIKGTDGVVHRVTVS